MAPDHEKIRNVIKVYDRGVESAGDRFRYFGNVELGSDVTIEDLRAAYHAVILSFGAQTDRQLAIPGEELPQVDAARIPAQLLLQHLDSFRVALAGDQGVDVLVPFPPAQHADLSFGGARI